MRLRYRQLDLGGPQGPVPEREASTPLPLGGGARRYQGLDIGQGLLQRQPGSGA